MQTPTERKQIEELNKQDEKISDLRWYVVYLYFCLFVALCMIAGLSGVIVEGGLIP